MKKHIEILLHIVAWVFILRFREISVNKHELFVEGYKNIGYYINTNHHLWLWHIIVTVFKVGFFYINVYWLFPKYLDSYQRSYYLKPLTINLIACMLAEFLTVMAVYNILLPLQGEGDKLGLGYNFLDAQLLPFSFLLLFSYCYWAARRWIMSQHDLRKLSKTTAELALLKTQINPHFLFNTLNNLFSMAIEKQATELAESIAQLTQMMRYTIYESNVEYVPLPKEIAYIENYIKLQQLRFSQEEVPVRFTIKGEVQHVQIAPMLLINFVENAFKHGISLKKESFINIDLKVDDSRIFFKVVNTVHRQNKSASLQHAGFGMENTQKLLNLQYPNRHTLQMQEENDLFKVALLIQLQKQKIEVVA